MESYRQLQAAKWQQQVVSPTPPLIEDEVPAEIKDAPLLIRPLHSPLTPEQESRIDNVLIDRTSLQSIVDAKIPRTGILMGDISEDGKQVIIDAIYECSQDSLTGESLIDQRLDMVIRISSLMRIRPVGILITGNLKAINSKLLLRAAQLQKAVAHVILMIEDGENSVIILTSKCLEHVENGSLKPDTTLTGLTVNGGLVGETLYRTLSLGTRAHNDIIHTGFYRLNRPNHTPTPNDVRAFIIARRDKAGISELHTQLADYHLILYLADLLGEPTAERIVLSILQQEDALVEDLMEIILNSTGDLAG